MDDGLARRRSMSRYAQMRLTVTFERRGTCSYRFFEKEPLKAWDEGACVAQGLVQLGHFPAERAEALAVMASILENLRWAPE